MALDSTKTLNGAYGKLYHEGVHLTNVYGVELTIDVNYEDIMRSGTRWLGKKATTLNATGTVSSYKVSSDLVDAISQIMDDRNGAFVTELHVQVDDPENPDMNGMYRIKGVQFNTIPVLSFEHGSIVEEELQFVFEGYERLD